MPDARLERTRKAYEDVQIVVKPPRPFTLADYVKHEGGGKIDSDA